MGEGFGAVAFRGRVSPTIETALYIISNGPVKAVLFLASFSLRRYQKERKCKVYKQIT